MIKYYCDRCGKEMGKQEFVDVSLDADIIREQRENSFAKMECHLCDECTELFKVEVNKVLEPYKTAYRKEKFIEKA